MTELSKHSFDVEISTDGYKSVIFEGKRFYDVGRLSKSFNCEKCKHSSYCESDEIFRFFDCNKNFRKVNVLYNLITNILVLMFVLFIFKNFEFSLFKSIAFIILGITSFDILCTSLESLVFIIRNNLFYKKLLRFEKKREEIKRKKLEEEKTKVMLEEKAKKEKNPYYDDIINAENFVMGVKRISDEIEFGSSDKKVEECVTKLMEIIESLKQDGSGYRRVSSLFTGYLPEFYNMLELYAKFLKANAMTPEYDEILEKSVDKFLLSLNDHRIAAILDKTATEIEFKASASVLDSIIDNGGFIKWICKLEKNGLKAGLLW